ncbi:hypothetical protein SAMN06265371_103203 [Lutibacter agarilyticus]|uniref:Uncharacterized protein n=1 Tax=Lutibacter agarilyticus TaxID=1109740 RepID=A0A238WHB5_9FLAO|nr:hypothetical protein [Lutibacter agarilyticus]SNR45721.1 hypothetical protein SAMN06265371_103203 [Lutibacter agarilyticus]
MLRTFSTFCLIILASSTLFAQKSIKDYKYIIVPKQYEFQKREDQHQINSLTKFLFEKEEFIVFFSDESFPEELALNACAALKAIVNDESGMLSTKVTISLVDCYNKVIYTTPEGRSKIKDYKKGYHQAIRNAFVNIQELDEEVEGETTEEITAIEAVVAESAEEQVVAVSPVETAVKEEIAETKSEVEVKAVKEASAPVAVAAIPVVVPKKEAKEIKESKPDKAAKAYTIEGTYFIDMWGECVISKKGNDYKVVGGDEDFEFAEIYTTSKPTIFMVKKTGFKQTQLLEIDESGNLKIDSKSGIKIYKRIN